MWLLISLLLFGSTAVAQNDSATPDQTSPPSMMFDVASVRPVKMEPGRSHPALEGGFQPSDSSHFTMTIALPFLLETAFSVQYYQMVGFDQFAPHIPGLYVIEARSDEDTDKRLATLPKAQREAEQHHMLQALLKDRFQLKFHWEDRLLPGYRLVIAKRGSKLLPAGSLPMDSDFLSWRSNGKIAPYHTHHDDLHGTLFVVRRASLADIVSIALVRMHSPIQDSTGLDGEYDFDLRVGDRTANDNPEENPQAWPQMVDALQAQLGLRLEAAQIMQKVLVIDHLEAPNPN